MVEHTSAPAGRSSGPVRQRLARPARGLATNRAADEDTSILPCAASAKKAEGAVAIIPLTRANNISIMLTQFSNFRRGPDDIRRAVCAGELGPERLSLLLQVKQACWQVC